MPTLNITTNIDGSKFDEEFYKQFTVQLAASIGKPEKFILIHVLANQMMSFGGSTDPCAILSLGTMDSTEDDRSRLANLLFEKMEKLGVPKDRMYVIFEDNTRDKVAWNGRLFSTK